MTTKGLQLQRDRINAEVLASMNKRQRALFFATTQAVADNARLQVAQLMCGYAFALGQGVETFPIDY